MPDSDGSLWEVGVDALDHQGIRAGPVLAMKC